MSEVPHHEFRETNTLRFARLVTRHRGKVAVFLILSILFFFYPILNCATTLGGAPLPGPTVPGISSPIIPTSTPRTSSRRSSAALRSWPSPWW
jgi:hypothetical protein